MKFRAKSLSSLAPPPTAFSSADVQKMEIRLIGDPPLTCHLQPLSLRRAVSDLSTVIQTDSAPPS
nr:unnamed protein product [Callosobruchus chinensis]